MNLMGCCSCHLLDEQDHELLRPSCKLQSIYTDDIAGVFSGPICSILSMSLTKLFFHYGELEHFTEKEESALQRLISLQKLTFQTCPKLQCLPSVLHRLPTLRRLEIWNCPAIVSLPKDGLPSSLQQFVVLACGNDELKQQPLEQTVMDSWYCLHQSSPQYT
uniref:NB-ARC domain-containing protein n=1 Tax=Leersia perrieri TaxID=77586 RepID=A0A0D9XZ36_9ORYZ